MAYGDSEHPISFRLEPELVGEHVKVTVRCGIAGSRALCGTLTLRPEDWAMLRLILATAPFPPLENADSIYQQAVLMEGLRYPVKRVSMEPVKFGPFADEWPAFDERLRALAGGA